MSQTERILNYLLKGNPITPLDALNKFGCFRLSGRILELRQQGYEIKTKIVKTNSGARIAEYHLNGQLELL